MSDRGGGGDNLRAWIRGAMVAAVIVMLVVLGGMQGKLTPARVKPMQVVGIAIMLASVALTAFSGKLAARSAESRRESVSLAMKLVSVIVCAAGALMVFIA
jgi:hypothetical protein